MNDSVALMARRALVELDDYRFITNTDEPWQGLGWSTNLKLDGEALKQLQ